MTLPFGNPGYFASGIRAARYLIAAGGGGGGDNTALMGSPGGAGGVKTALIDIQPGSYPVVIGAGGAGAGAGLNNAQKGGDSSLGSLLSVFGGGSGRQGGSGAPYVGMDGGSGAGAPNGGVYAGGLGTPGQGYNGGASAPTGGSTRGAGGGGGAGGPGLDGTSGAPGAGGPGLVSNITGSNEIYGIGASVGTPPPGYGHGGGGAIGNPSSTQPGNAGRPGILILWYPGAVRSSGGVITPLNGGVLQVFTANGTLTVF